MRAGTPPDPAFPAGVGLSTVGRLVGKRIPFLSALQENPLNSTDVLLQTLAGQVQSEYISNKLVITSPSRQTTTTGESLVVFQGSADPNFPLLLNGEEVELSEHGYFALKNLSIGKNTFAFSHKNQTVTYVVTITLSSSQERFSLGNLALREGQLSPSVPLPTRIPPSMPRSMGRRWR